MKATPKRSTILLRLPRSVHQRLRAHSRKTGVPQSRLVLDAVRHLLDGRKEARHDD